MRSHLWWCSNHWDYEFLEGIYGLIELNWFHWIRSGGALPGVNFEGGDLHNLGSGDVTNNDIVRLAAGGRWKRSDSLSFGAAWEKPLTNRRDRFHDRVTVDAILRY